MADYFVIVESPAKAKTIKKFLGSRYSVQASMGHLRDLPKSQLGVDVEHDFEPRYITIRGKGALLAKLKKEAKGAKKIFLATDPDREGEAISWHLAQVLGVDEENAHRVAFNEITKDAVKHAIKNPRKIDQNLVDAQQARRVLDRIVGYKISPLLWKKVKKGLSAGRVQSVATRLVVDREREIEEFVPQEYWTLTAKLNKQEQKTLFEARFYGNSEGKMELETGEQVAAIMAQIDKQPYVVQQVKKRVKTRNPAAPFITSTLQQEASRKLNFTSKRTMQAAQQLYEGVDVAGRGSVGLITYMRTDSLRISEEAQAATLQYIKEQWGADYLPEKPRVYKVKKGSQDAHEAIRPTDVTITPADIKADVSADAYKIYQLIWERFVASQMASALFDTVQANISVGDYLFRATGSTMQFAGFMKVYVEGVDDKEEAEGKLPTLHEGETLVLKELLDQQHFTEPPPRYTEASLIKQMEEQGIGRPSTYAPTISTILARNYVAREKKALYPTELGIVVTDLMLEHFNEIVDIDFTVHMEQKLDEVEEGGMEWKEIIRDFYSPFMQALEKAEEEIGKIEVKDEESDVPCEKCGRMMVYKMGRFGKFLACPGFPECRNAKPIVIETGVECPLCGARVLSKKTKRGKIYYGCERNPECEFMSWDLPLKEKCPQCNKMLFEKQGRNKKKYCADKECGYERKEEA